MKISFPKCGPSELLMRKRSATWVISFVAIGLVAGVCGSFLLGNRLWLLTIMLLGIAAVLLSLGVVAAIFLNQSEVHEAPSAPIEEEAPPITPQWEYRPSKPIRAPGVLNSPSSETSDNLSSDPLWINDNVWLNENSLENAAPTFVSGPPETEESITTTLPETTDSVGPAPSVDDATVSR
jgi:hypothetical protein